MKKSENFRHGVQIILNLTQKRQRRSLWTSERKKETPPPLALQNENVERVTSYKYLGVTITEKLDRSKNIQLLVKKGQQRLYFMRTLRSFKVDKTILQLFHRALVETVLTFSIICSFSQLTIRDRTKLQRVIFRSSKIAGIEFPPH